MAKRSADMHEVMIRTIPAPLPLATVLCPYHPSPKYTIMRPNTSHPPRPGVAQKQYFPQGANRGFLSRLPETTRNSASRVDASISK